MEIEIIISIHAPREGSDRTRCRFGPPRRYFYPRSPHGERLTIGAAEHRVEVISIHAPREGSDGTFAMEKPATLQFLSTLPVRGATNTMKKYNKSEIIFLSTLPVRGATPTISP